MTTPGAGTGDADHDDDQSVHVFAYGHGRMPLFMKFVWLGFLAFIAWYVVSFLLEALGTELA